MLCNERTIAVADFSRKGGKGSRRDSHTQTETGCRYRGQSKQATRRRRRDNCWIEEKGHVFGRALDLQTRSDREYSWDAK